MRCLKQKNNPKIDRTFTLKIHCSYLTTLPDSARFLTRACI
ncbi:hypothetical protein NT05HA_2227 [Aggregatibacter aphrophilus NJ8700]|nr:hypothetical protein NT05HA_2227 [Aggregatibacter aphrophilus NJ8700]